MPLEQINNNQNFVVLNCSDSLLVQMMRNGYHPSTDGKRNRLIKVAKTCILVYSWICLGLFSEILGPTLPTLMHQTQSNYEQIGFALSMRSVGLLIGSLIGGLVSDRWSRARHLQMSSALLIAASTNFILPWIHTLPSLVFVLFCAGYSHGLLTTGGNPLLGSIWVDKASGPFNLMHAGYGIGAAITPLMVSPFGIPTNGSNITSPMTTTTKAVFTAHVSNSSGSALVDPVIPYTIVGSILISCAIFFLPFNIQMLYCNNNCRSTRFRCCGTQIDESSSPVCPKSNMRKNIHSTFSKISKSLHPSKLAENAPTILCILCVTIAYFAVVGNERVFGKFMFPYAIFGPVQMPPSKAYLLHLAYWVCFASARLLASLLSIWVPARVLLISIAIGTVLSSAGLVLIPYTTTWFFVFTCLFSVCKSPLFCVILGAISRSKEITGLIVLFVNLGSAAGASLMQYATGALIQAHGQTVFPYVVCATACVVFLASILLLIILKRLGDRFQPKFIRAHVTDGVI